MGCLQNIITPPNPCANSVPCGQYTNAACVQFNGILPCIPGNNLTLDVILRGMCGLISGGGAQVLTAKITLNKTQLSNAFTTPVQLLPSPGTGRFIQLLSAYAIYTYGTTPYVANGANYIFLGQNGTSYVAYGSISLLTSGTSGYGATTPIGAVTPSTFVNQPLYYYNDVANISGGDGTLTIYLTYVITTA